MQYSFVFNVSSTNPLLPCQSAQTTSTFMGPDFESSLHYPLTVSGALGRDAILLYRERPVLA